MWRAATRAAQEVRDMGKDGEKGRNGSKDACLMVHFLLKEFDEAVVKFHFLVFQCGNPVVSLDPDCCFWCSRTGCHLHWRRVFTGTRFIGV